MDFGIPFANNLIVGLQIYKLISIFKSLVGELDLEREFIDGGIVKAHQHCTRAVSDGDEAIGKSVIGNTTKIHMEVETTSLHEYDHII